MDRQNFINRHIELATRAAHTGQHRQHRIGAILVKKGKVVSIGANNRKTHPLMAGFKTLHAEVCCLLGVRWSDLSGSIIFVARVNGTGKIGMSKPCSTCQEVLIRYGIRKAYYTTANSVEELRLS
jgi:tRNA(Arg) A34 adenosine deaminase TadA